MKSSLDQFKRRGRFCLTRKILPHAPNSCDQKLKSSVKAFTNANRLNLATIKQPVSSSALLAGKGHFCLFV